MHSSLLLTTLLGLGASAAPVIESRTSGQVPFKFPLKDGFPNIKVPSAELTNIEKHAHGSLPNGPLPTAISDASATTFQVIAVNEIFEVAYFSSLIDNITHGGWEVPKTASKSKVLTALHAVRAQEKLHALGANALLASAGRPTIEPCEYVFPNTNVEEAIALAATFTDVVLGTLQDAILTFGTTGDTEVLPLVGSIIGQEGEQTGFYRNIGDKIPSALPFLTRSAGILAYSAINQLFIVPGSCPNANVIDVPILPALTVVTLDAKPKDQTAKFSFKCEGVDPSTLSVVYINQQNLPIVEKLENIQSSGDMVTFDAVFPGKTNLMNGLTLAVITTTAGPFADADAVAAVAKAGPGIIEIN